jgi:DNA-binding MarR family transcriptional regulator
MVIFAFGNNNYAVAYQANMRTHIDKAAARTPRDADIAAMPEAVSAGAHDARSEANVTARPLGGDIGPLAGMIGYALRRAQLAAFDEAIREIADLDLRLGQFSVLALIGHRPGSKQSEVAAALGIQRANFVALLDGLERRGLARRAPAPNDRRCHAVYLTAEGERVLARASARLAATEARLAARLGAGGRERLLEMLWRLAGDGGTPERP